MELLDTEPARQHRGIVYLWLTERPIPRLKGESRIIYIGKTKAKLRERHRRYADVEASDQNWPNYEYIIRQFGPITFRIAHHSKFAETPKEAEKQLFKKYGELHLETPPINRTAG